MINHDFETIKHHLRQHFTTLQQSIERGRVRLITLLKARYEHGKRRLQETRVYAQRNASTFFVTYGTQIKQNSLTHFTRLKDQLKNAWRRWKPSIDRLVHASIAISTSTSALNVSIKIAPIIFSALSVLATAPLISAIVPSFLLYKSSIILILTGTSIFAGYNKYRELIERANLDAQIRKNQEEITQLRAGLNEMRQRYTPQQHSYDLRSRTPSRTTPHNTNNSSSRNGNHLPRPFPP